MWGRWGSVDEVSFGPRREIRLPSRYRRAFTVIAAVVAAGAVAVGAGLAVTRTAGAGTDTSAPHTAGATATAPPGQVSCPPARAVPPNLAAFPAGMRIGALKIVIDAEFSGQCQVGR
jgi:hypothetical protein